MPYPQLEELTSRRHEKVALFLTAENMAGLFAIGLPAYIGTLHTVLVLRIGILIAAAVLGVALTSDINGMAFYDRVLWWARGWVRRRTVGAILRPADFTALPVSGGDRALPLASTVRRVRGSIRDQASASRLTGMARLPRSLSSGPAPSVAQVLRTAPDSVNDHDAPDDARPSMAVEDDDADL